MCFKRAAILKRPQENYRFLNDSDVNEYHDNFPTDKNQFIRMIRSVKAIEEITRIPVWITEWQRTCSTTGWGGEPIIPEETKPALVTLADVMHEYRIGNFFWSLMLKPAYLKPQRLNGTFNGIFHEDGSVYSLKDAQAVSGNLSFSATEKPCLPEWYSEEIKKSSLNDK